MLLVHPTRNSGGVSTAAGPRTKEQVSPRRSKRRLSTLASNGTKCDSLLGPAASGGPASIPALCLCVSVSQQQPSSPRLRDQRPLQTGRGETPTCQEVSWMLRSPPGDESEPQWTRERPQPSETRPEMKELTGPAKISCLAAETRL